MHVRFEYSDVLMMTQNIGTPHPMIATPNTAEQIRVTMCTYVCVCVCWGGGGGERVRECVCVCMKQRGRRRCACEEGKEGRKRW